MKQLHNTTRIQIPPNLPVPILMSSLENGHGYTWLRLLSSPKLWVYGRPPVGELPEVLIMGKNILLETEEENVLRFRRMLKALSQENMVLGGRIDDKR